ncbi:MAG: hypothetical protein MUC43_06750 [Pirellula sp.]|nr:hypothetical protein [Pirellula sp.]
MKLNSSIIRQSINQLNVPWKSQWESWVGHAYVDEEELRLLDRPLLGIVSSHLKQNAFASQRWQNALMSALSFAREQNAAVFYSASTPYAAAIRNACIKTNSQSIQVDELQSGSLRSTIGCGKPSVAIDCEMDVASSDLRALPFLDRLIIALSHQVFVLDVDPAGKIAKLIERRLLSADFPKGSVFLAHHSRTEPPRKHRWVQSQLDRGAVAWLVRDTKQKTAPIHCQEGTHFCSVPIFPAKMLTQSASSFLIHCTRARQGAWPDQSTSQFYDELLINPWASPPSSLQSLQRILENQRLVATSHLKSGAKPTISFTQRTLSELLIARTFEAHLARWDWEPYGLMISRQWLEAAGCKPVIYLTRDELKNVSAEDMIFTQPYEHENAANKKGRDWRVEQEWRLPDDLRLHQVPLSRAIVFVKHSWEARLLATISNWPICFTES